MTDFNVITSSVDFTAVVSAVLAVAASLAFGYATTALFRKFLRFLRQNN